MFRLQGLRIQDAPEGFCSVSFRAPVFFWDWRRFAGEPEVTSSLGLRLRFLLFEVGFDGSKSWMWGVRLGD